MEHKHNHPRATVVDPPPGITREHEPWTWSGRYRPVIAGAVLRSGMTCLVLGVLAAVFTFILSRQVPERLFQEDRCDAYFGSDLPLTYQEMVAPTPASTREARHPLYSLLMISFTIPLHRLGGVSLLTASRVALAANALVWVCLLFLLARTLTERVLDSALLVLLALSCASAVFWLPMPETFPMGSTTILVPLALLCLPGLGGNYVLHVAGQVLSVSMTLTNWMSGLIVSCLGLNLRKTLAAALHALAIVYLLSCVQSKVLSRPNGFARSMGQVVVFKDSLPTRRPLPGVLTDFFLTSLSPAQLQYRVIPKGEPWPKNDLPSIDVLNRSGPVLKTIRPWGVAGRWCSILAWLTWSALLASGFCASLRYGRQSFLLRAILLCVAGQLILHCFYGHETFLFSMHWCPLLVLMTGSVLRTRWRPAALVAIVFLIAHNFAGNMIMYQAAMNALH
jgi:hypothetical protein